jgi:hypothetical protein
MPLSNSSVVEISAGSKILIQYFSINRRIKLSKPG